MTSWRGVVRRLAAVNSRLHYRCSSRDGRSADKVPRFEGNPEWRLRFKPLWQESDTNDGFANATGVESHIAEDFGAPSQVHNRCD
jgi:hypothetical protein